MSTPSPDRDPKPTDRSKLVGRLMVIGLLVLVLIYVVPVLISRFS